MEQSLLRGLIFSRLCFPEFKPSENWPCVSGCVVHPTCPASRRLHLKRVRRLPQTEGHIPEDLNPERSPSSVANTS